MEVTQMPFFTVYQLKTGEEIKIINNFFSSTRVTYAGMPNKKTFSLVINERYLHNTMGYNLYFPTTQKEIKSTKGAKDKYKWKIKVLSITPEEITMLGYIK